MGEAYRDERADCAEAGQKIQCTIGILKLMQGKIRHGLEFTK